MKIDGLGWRLCGRWFIWRDWWMPNGLFCWVIGHGETTWYDGEWCLRCGGPVTLDDD